MGIGGLLAGEPTEPYLAKGLSGTPRIGGMVAGANDYDKIRSTNGKRVVAHLSPVWLSDYRGPRSVNAYCGLASALGGRITELLRQSAVLVTIRREKLYTRGPSPCKVTKLYACASINLRI
jgi:hypothetical protein